MTKTRLIALSTVASLALTAAMAPALAQEAGTDQPPIAGEPEDTGQGQGGTPSGPEGGADEPSGEGAGFTGETESSIDHTGADADPSRYETEATTTEPAGMGATVESGPAAGAGGRGPDAWMETPDSWATFNGDLMAQKYSPADQITPENVGNLEKVWEYHTGDVSDGSEDIPTTVWSATPLFVNDTLYIGTPFYRIIALEPATGEEKWVFDPDARLEALTQPAMKNRGVAYWQADEPQEGEACQKIVYIGTMDAKLYGVDADTGETCDGFGDGGVVDVNQWNTVNAKWPLSLLQPPTVYNDTLFLGWAGKDWTDSAAPPGTVFALDARSGELKWMFHALPNEVIERTGTANVWASMSLDPERGLLYLPISSPSPNYYGGNRLEELPLATSVTAVDTETGEVAWSRQLVHHDIWDYDTVAPPTLVDIEKDGETVPALVQTSKQGFIYVLNRETGEDVYPVEERPVPASDIEGEEASPTQPFVDTPAPVVDDDWPGVFWLADLVAFGGCSERAEGVRWEGRFTPPSLEGTIAYPPTTGGAQWGGGSVDPRTGIYVVNTNSVVQIYTLIPREEFQEEGQEGETAGFYAQGDVPYGFQLETFLNWAGMPCWNPPYGHIQAYDLKTGERLWRHPFGQVQRYGFYMPESWGSVTIGGPVITASGLIFIGASMDSRVRALSLETGEVLWQDLVEAPAVSLPAVYTYQGRQYVTFIVGGNTILLPKVSDQVVTYALPQD
ncbi:pyrroloquinoline quinone-dependent dehydrogenase [Lutibaculum baratangense]|uniref:Glucose dehydrogenase, PQQ-dependent n=1 Tax=Lutibaculum baratangense AMV1 TaxID=631454 RepID=V4QSV6_9HYPH|nr:pyrroloquinoline quinone-dependent dehydrogenase [Lutibaculum baratangense]ESR22852.1 Glucose dehydrogenase, PQQ-dependent [Lutibaculum baratangense AMV1]